MICHSLRSCLCELQMRERWLERNAPELTFDPVPTKNDLGAAVPTRTPKPGSSRPNNRPVPSWVAQGSYESLVGELLTWHHEARKGCKRLHSALRLMSSGVQRLQQECYFARDFSANVTRCPGLSTLLPRMAFTRSAVRSRLAPPDFPKS